MPYAPPVMRNNVVRLVLVAVGSMVALAGCGGAGPPAARSGPTAAPAESPITTASAARGAPTTVTTPTALLGRAVTAEQATLDLFHKAFQGFSSKPGSAIATQAYGSVAERNAAMFWAATGTNSDPAGMLDAAGRVWFKNSRFHSVDPGPLGGAARCTSVLSGQTELTQCIWATATVFGVLYVFFLDPAMAEEEFRKVRPLIEVAK